MDIGSIFTKRECSHFIPGITDPLRCGCGRSRANHHPSTILEYSSLYGFKWQSQKHSQILPTDAYGVIEFNGSGIINKAQFLRLSHDTNPESVLQFLLNVWSLELPKLLISIHGGNRNFLLEPRIKRCFHRGLLQAARTTNAWIFTGGINAGVNRHTASALGERILNTKHDVTAIGIAPWGVIEKKEELTRQRCITNFPLTSSNKGMMALSNHHTHFLLADNGSVNKFGADHFLRRRLERCIAEKAISPYNNQKVPIVVVVLEGGPSVIHSVLDYVTSDSPVPVVVIEGSGRAADLITYTYKCMQDDGNLLEGAYEELFMSIQTEFSLESWKVQQLIEELITSVRRKELITIVSPGETDNQELNIAIFTAILKSKNISPAEKLSWALTWNNVEIAKTEVFTYGIKWPEKVLELAMFEALSKDKVEFVQLLLEQGVDMQTFLTIPQLEQLYNSKEGPNNTLHYLVRSVRQRLLDRTPLWITLPDVGLVIESLMSGVFRSNYCEKKFKLHYQAVMRLYRKVTYKEYSLMELIVNGMGNACEPSSDLKLTFDFPFNELFCWAVLMNRQKMAVFMWQHGEEAMAKALVGCKLNQAMASEAAEDDLEWDIYEEFNQNARKFQFLSLQLLMECYKQDAFYSQQLLTFELKNWSKQTCISLAYASKFNDFIAHNCCQTLISQMWMGGLIVPKNRSFKILMGILLPPTIFLLDFKTKEELQYTPQTVEEYISISTDANFQEESHTLDKCNYVNEGFERDDFEDLEVNFEGFQPSENIMDSSWFNDDNIENTNSKKHRLKLGRKIHKFYTAPITKFWLHTISYLVFIALFITMVLCKMDPIYASIPEWIVILYVYTYAMEKIRDIITSEMVTLKKKCADVISNRWYWCDLCAVVLFTIGSILRFKESTFSIGRCFYCIDIIFWIVRVLYFFGVHMDLGPYVLTIKKMLKHTYYFTIIIFLMIICYGVVRQAIRYPDKKLSWTLLYNITFEPHFMVYGQLFTKSINAGCDVAGDECTTGSWVLPILTSIYLLMSYMVLVNLLIVNYKKTVDQVSGVTLSMWKYQRYELIMEYHRRPIPFPPLIFFYHLWKFYYFVIHLWNNKTTIHDNELKLFLNDDDLKKLYQFEEECAMSYMHNCDQSEERSLQTIQSRMENIGQQMVEQKHRKFEIWQSKKAMEFRLSKLQKEITRQQIQLLSLSRVVMGKMFSHKSNTNLEPPEQKQSIRKTSAPNMEIIQRHAAFSLRQQSYSEEMKSDVDKIRDIFVQTAITESDCKEKKS